MIEALEARIAELLELREIEAEQDAREFERLENRISELEYQLEEARNDASYYEEEYDRAESDRFTIEQDYEDYRRNVRDALRGLLALASDPAVRYGKPFETVEVKIGDLQDLLDAYETL